ncbi:hypothetical protein [Devosia sp. 63-57]|uniref:hypothetical protein n=1 Tax=Devosia sp. 63-57 TaxID=1895751 RepID=UPI000868462E|nr:hypothetical protein [Devosia sp. 63-57]ODT48187.1 MAG: hypothetical protein ABS74_18630 [Pelagibacterium sp. SCN 63-126]ODU85362.1 MAG: hypothetical protein ABT14_12930 [Pelagibacterium sp. SCN 63-17]OJX42104.1 MAG: hypothetical protein BGO80_11220 [Devosia sp. 63-57]
MFKNSVIALTTAALLVGAAAPAFADSFDSDLALARLQEQGINATAAEEWGDLVRAFVVTPEGRSVMQFYSTDTLSPVSL